MYLLQDQSSGSVFAYQDVLTNAASASFLNDENIDVSFESSEHELGITPFHLVNSDSAQPLLTHQSKNSDVAFELCLEQELPPPCKPSLTQSLFQAKQFVSASASFRNSFLEVKDCTIEKRHSFRQGFEKDIFIDKYLVIGCLFLLVAAVSTVASVVRMRLVKVGNQSHQCSGWKLKHILLVSSLVNVSGLPWDEHEIKKSIHVSPLHCLGHLFIFVCTSSFLTVPILFFKGSTATADDGVVKNKRISHNVGDESFVSSSQLSLLHHLCRILTFEIRCIFSQAAH